MALGSSCAAINISNAFYFGVQLCTVKTFPIGYVSSKLLYNFKACLVKLIKATLNHYVSGATVMAQILQLCSYGGTKMVSKGPRYLCLLNMLKALFYSLVLLIS